MRTKFKINIKIAIVAVLAILAVTWFSIGGPTMFEVYSGNMLGTITTSDGFNYYQLKSTNIAIKNFFDWWGGGTIQFNYVEGPNKDIDYINTSNRVVSITGDIICGGRTIYRITMKNFLGAYSSHFAASLPPAKDIGTITGDEHNANPVCYANGVTMTMVEDHCPNCQIGPGEWSECYGGIQTRQVNTCGIETQYRCISSIETQECEIENGVGLEPPEEQPTVPGDITIWIALIFSISMVAIIAYILKIRK